MALILRGRMHHELSSRAAKDAVPVYCDVDDIEFAWPVSAGNPVKCPTCHTTADLDLEHNPAVAAQIKVAQKDAVKGE